MGNGFSPLIILGLVALIFGGAAFIRSVVERPWYHLMVFVACTLGLLLWIAWRWWRM
ncbi:hypothetical protein [Anaerobiospirillum sp. NML120449]|uniref:hypothetical protein n=1 Tax=Anaerobiospirillum sp. NML120449 TaxID=2932817 RepID=UPI001FF0E9E2|nr:hypothetical protein [Anaerobiospirillum sp. NML120449]MCK0525899.1 hypothetical protein [Anaerobiospirillum sp. NML120449]